MFHKERKYSARLLCSAAVGALAIFSTPAYAQELTPIEIAPQPLAKALGEFAAQTKRSVLVTPDLTVSRTSSGVSGETDPEAALYAMLDGTGLTFRRDGDTFLIVKVTADPQSGSAAGDGADGTVEALIVTAQKREEDIQDVPIAISAFTQEQLTDRQVAGGPDLMTQVPNFTFTKTNFSSYSIQIRGIGTQAISATTDPAVAIAFNNTPFVRNRFFEQEFYDLQRVEVLRGPQGTLYGRNATAGVVNIISEKPKFSYEARLSGDIANYKSTRIEGMVNVPLVEDKVALRLAGAWTKREGFVTNEITGNPIDGRDLWSSRVSLRFAPTDRFDANLIWEHFQEDDDRLRSGKQLCSTHVVHEVAGFTRSGGFSDSDPGYPLEGNSALPNTGQGGVGSDGGFTGAQAVWSQGCAPESLYSPDSFRTPNGFSLPYYLPLDAVGLPAALNDPYVRRTQSHDLRVIESTVDPKYRARTDVVELQLNIDLTDALSLSSETAWASDFIFSMQDFNRFNTAPGAFENPGGGGWTDDVEDLLTPGEFGGVFCDPQIGCADRLVAMDLSTAKSKHFSQEFRLASNFDGDFNFSLGANFLRYDTEDKYYVFINSLGIITGIAPFGAPPLPPYEYGETNNRNCMRNGPQPPNPFVPQPVLSCTYMDPNPIESLNDQGHNYFLSRNPYKLISYAMFGEAYYQVSDTLKVTAGLRWTVDKKEAPRIPSWLLASQSVGYPVMEVIEQEWREPTGRITVDWKPDLAFTDETLLYASYAHGYKAGGANPPPFGVALAYVPADVSEVFIQESLTNPKTFDPEFIDAFEVGAKNTMFDGRLTMNLAGFYYDYQGYQISQIVDRSASNMNFDAKVWGLELEADWRPLENLKLGLKLGYENTEVADGEKAIDIMDRTAGTPGWIVVRPFPSIPSNCILPEWLFVGTRGTDRLVNLGGAAGGNPSACELAYAYNFDPVSRKPYEPFPTTGGTIGDSLYLYETSGPQAYPGWNPLDESEFQHNHGQGFFKQLGGNELPNAPNFTATLTADYTIPLPNDWLATLHTDFYYQSEAWTRIFNMEGYDRLKAYTNVNLAAIFTNEPGGWKVMAYVKNVFDRDSITGAFLNSDDTGLTTNVFLTEPRLYGLRVTKDWNGGPWWTGANPAHTGPYPLTVEIGGQVQQHDAPYDLVTPTFADVFPDTLQPTAAQNGKLDWGDGREVKLTYAVPNGPWSVSAGLRIGKTNGADKALAREETATGCVASQALCEFYGNPKYYFHGFDYTDVAVTNREEHTLIDFAVGREIGLGGSLKSKLSAGLRYAQFESRTGIKLYGVSDWYIPAEYAIFGYSHNTHYTADLVARREFEGAGPTLSWDASQPLFGDDEMGHINLDVSATAGVLFGKQKTRVDGEETSAYFYGKYYGGLSQEGPTTVFAPSTEPRSKSVTAPMLDLSLGLSYDIQRVKIGAGYRWERYFDILDAGFEERRKEDRTIDGPYFKLSVGFGG